MTHNRICIRVHIIYSTKNREPLISDDLQLRTWAFIGGIARGLRMTALAVGGFNDHLHALLQIPPTMAIATAVQKLKANSSRWLRRQTGQPFQWQEGYGAFTVGLSHTAATVRYIHRQREHHQKVSYEDEFKRILRAHGFDTDDIDWS